MSEMSSADRAWNDEIDLVDLMAVLLQHRLLFMAVFLASLALATVYATLTPKQYEYQVSLEIGGYWIGIVDGSTFSGRFEKFESPESVVSKIKDAYGPEVLRQARLDDGDMPQEFDVKTEKGSDIVKVSLKAPLEAGDQSKALLDTVSSRVISDHQTMLAERKRLKSSFLERRIAELDQQIEELRAGRESILERSSGETKALSILMMDTTLNELLSQRAEFMEELTVGLETNLKPTRILNEPARNLRPVSPGMVLILAVGAFVGFVLGGFAVFLSHILKTALGRDLSRSAA